MKRGASFLTVGLIWVGLLGAAQPATASSSSDLTYYGGPVAHSMNVILVEWGSTVRSTYTDPSTGDPAFFSYLASQSGSTSDIGGVLAQYMDTTGANSKNQFSYGGENQITPPTSGGGSHGCSLPSCVEDSQIQSTLQGNIASSTLPAPAGNGLSTLYVVLFPANVDVCQGNSCAFASNGFCAYHGSFPMSSTHVLYAVMVDNGPGTPNYGLCGPSSNDLDNQTEIMSHEFSESINDPLVAESGNSYGPPLAWYNAGLGEIGDICVGAGEQAPNGPWTVQKIWSNLDETCVAGESAYSAPTASFLAPSVAAPGQAPSFDASSSTDPTQNTAAASYLGTSYSIPSGLTSYQWNWGDGSPVTTSSTPMASHIYTALGNYEVSLTVADGLGFTSTVTKEVSIAAGGAPVDVQTLSASDVTDQGATLNGVLNPQQLSGTYRFLYGTSPSALNQSTPPQALPSGETAMPVSASVSGLSQVTTYYDELEVVSGGQTYTGQVLSFTTSVSPTSVAPSVTTAGASSITSSEATVAGSVNPNGLPTTYHVEFGNGTSYGQSTAATSAGSGSGAVPVSVVLTGLKARTTYHYRFVATNAVGTSVGADQTFKTARRLAAAPRFSFTVIGRPTVARALARGLRVRFTCSRGCTAQFTVLVVPSGRLLQFTSSLLTVGHGHRRIRAAGSSTASITFIPKLRRRLQGRRLLKLLISGYAAGAGSVPSSPVAIRITLG